MSYVVLFEGSERKVTIENNETILEAAIRAGLDVNYGCSNGNCGLCTAQCIDGCVRETQSSDYVFPQEQRDGKHFLMCSNTADSDLQIAHQSLDDHNIPVQNITTKIKQIDCDDKGLVHLRLRIPRSQRLRFHAGQAAQLKLAEHAGQYAIASCPCDASEVAFYFCKDSDPLAGALCETSSKGQNLDLTAPFGNFIFSEDLERKAVLLAIGLGFTAIQSLAEHIIAQESEVPIHLYHNQSSEDHFGRLCRSWKDIISHFDYTVLEGQDNASLAQQFINCAPDLQSDFYLCAPEAINAELKAWLCDKGVPAEQILCQHITPSGQVL